MSILSILLGVLPATADRVELENGRHLSGRAEVQANGDVVVHTAAGTMRLSGNRVKRVVKSQTIEERIEKYIVSHPNPTAGTYFRLAEDAAEQGAETLANKLLWQAIGLDRDHEPSRRKLGFKRTPNGWLSHADLHRLRGDVYYDGRWMQRDEADWLRREREREEALDREQELRIRAAAIELERQRLAYRYERSHHRYSSRAGAGIALSTVYAPASPTFLVPPGTVIGPNQLAPGAYPVGGGGVAPRHPGFQQRLNLNPAARLAGPQPPVRATAPPSGPIRRPRASAPSQVAPQRNFGGRKLP